MPKQTKKTKIWAVLDSEETKTDLKALAKHLGISQETAAGKAIKAWVNSRKRYKNIYSLKKGKSL